MFLQAELSTANEDPFTNVPERVTVWRRPGTGSGYSKTPLNTKPIRSPYEFNQKSISSFKKTVDLSGGFYEDGPYGPIKLTKSNALNTAMLAWAILDAPDGFDPDLLVRFLMHKNLLMMHAKALHSGQDARCFTLVCRRRRSISCSTARSTSTTQQHHVILRTTTV